MRDDIVEIPCVLINSVVSVNRTAGSFVVGECSDRGIFIEQRATVYQSVGI